MHGYYPRNKEVERPKRPKKLTKTEQRAAMVTRGLQVLVDLRLMLDAVKYVGGQTPLATEVGRLQGEVLAIVNHLKGE
jgi:hypothetical protein